MNEGLPRAGVGGKGGECLLMDNENVVKLDGGGKTIDCTP